MMDEIRIRTAAELRRLLLLNALLDQVIKSELDLQDMARMVPKGWRDLRLSSSALKRVCNALFDLLDDKQLEYMAHTRANMEIRLAPRHIANVDPWAMIKYSDADVLIECSMRAECHICLRTDAEVRRCKLRRVLLAFYPPDERIRHGCEYAGGSVDTEVVL